MVLSIGIDDSRGTWKTCLMENGRPLELRRFNSASATIAYLQHICAHYPDPITKGFLIAIDSLSFNSYSLPPVGQVPTIPAYRRHHRLDMGTPTKLCAVAALLYRLRMHEASWQEMRFLYLDVHSDARSIIVVEDGRIVNGLGETAGSFYPYRTPWQDKIEESDGTEEAFWEGLTQDLAGLMAIHQLEDIVVTGSRKDAVIERFEDSYQFYDFPYNDQEEEGFEAATGAAIIAEGLYSPGSAAEVVEQLQFLQAGRYFSRLSPQFSSTFLKDRK